MAGHPARPIRGNTPPARPLAPGTPHRRSRVRSGILPCHQSPRGATAVKIISSSGCLGGVDSSVDETLKNLAGARRISSADSVSAEDEDAKRPGDPGKGSGPTRTPGVCSL